MSKTSKNSWHSQVLDTQSVPESTSQRFLGVRDISRTPCGHPSGTDLLDLCLCTSPTRSQRSKGHRNRPWSWRAHTHTHTQWFFHIFSGNVKKHMNKHVPSLFFWSCFSRGGFKGLCLTAQRVSGPSRSSLSRFWCFQTFSQISSAFICFLLGMEALLMLLAVQVAFCYAWTLQQRPSSGHGATWSGAQGTLFAGKWSFLRNIVFYECIGPIYEYTDIIRSLIYSNMYIGYKQILGECAFLWCLCWLRYLAKIGSHELISSILRCFGHLVCFRFIGFVCLPGPHGLGISLRQAPRTPSRQLEDRHCSDLCWWGADRVRCFGLSSFTIWDEIAWTGSRSSWCDLYLFNLKISKTVQNIRTARRFLSWLMAWQKQPKA